jgi:hypothetical protein
MSTSDVQLVVRGGSTGLAARARRTVVPTEGVSNRTIIWEALAACALVLGVALVLSPHDAGLRRPGPHLVWMAVLLVSARYGTRGLFLSLPLSAGVVAATAQFLGQMPTLEQRLDSSSDLLALVAVVLVAWVASTHENRRGELTAELDAVRNRSLSDRKAAREMRDMLIALRSRADRMNLSLTFLRNVAQRLEGGDPEEAAAAALTLAMTCLEARAGVIRIGNTTRGGTHDVMPGLVSAHGPWNSDGSTPTLEGDRVVETALGTAQPVNAADIRGVCVGDADMAAPLLDRQGKPFGVLAIRGLPYRAAGATALRDLAVVGDWLATVLTARNRRSIAETPHATAEDHDRRPPLELGLPSDLDSQPRSSEVQT